MTLIKTIIIWCGMYYATPQWMNKQLPSHFKSQYEVYMVPYGTPLHKIKHNIDPRTTALIGFSAGGLDVFKNYSPDYAFIGLIDPSTRPSYNQLKYTNNVHMLYDVSNWGNINKNLPSAAKAITNGGGEAIHIDMGHSEIPKYFFKTYFGI
jgi:hypothetical protein